MLPYSKKGQYHVQVAVDVVFIDHVSGVWHGDTLAVRQRRHCPVLNVFVHDGADCATHNERRAGNGRELCPAFRRHVGRLEWHMSTMLEQSGSRRRMHAPVQGDVSQSGIIGEGPTES